MSGEQPTRVPYKESAKLAYQSLQSLEKTINFDLNRGLRWVGVKTHINVPVVKGAIVGKVIGFAVTGGIAYYKWTHRNDDKNKSS